MIIKNKIRPQISAIVDVLIPSGKWEEYKMPLDRQGAFGKPNLISMLMQLCSSIEVLENAIEDLYFEIDLLKTDKKEDIEKITDQRIKQKETDKSFKLMNGYDVMKYLDSQINADTKAFYLNIQNWNILHEEKKEEGITLAIDPKNGRERSCIMYRDLPVFKN